MNAPMNLADIAVDRTADIAAERHVFRRVRHELKRRHLQVRRIVDIAPKMRRVTLAGADLVGFVSAAPDDHVKLFFPQPGSIESAPMRDYTPRRFDAESGELDIDFVLHGDGPAASWAAQVETGQTLEVGGPRGSMIPPDDFAGYLLAGDETALPSIARRLEELPGDLPVTVVVEIADASERQTLPERARPADVRWVLREGSEPGERLQAALSGIALPAADCYVWVATESQRAQAIRQLFVEKRGHAEDSIKAVGYWQR
ncbi:siderophore-interacting protein [Hydrocarboniphaga effusa]|jgi:NADPH-dependent ferric siderophore reductase|uniref:siderophore-interacting protein n=2 Tax=Hydrocarboniphaga effusa TaxID=243629 RepID=UPI003BA89888